MQDPVKREETRKYNKEYAKKNRARLNALSNKRYRELAVEMQLQRKKLPMHHAEAIRKHKGRCDICGKKPDGRWKKLNIDHCHKKRMFRGMLCGNCNRGIGYFKDNPELLKKAVLYLRKVRKA